MSNNSTNKSSKVNSKNESASAVSMTTTAPTSSSASVTSSSITVAKPQGLFAKLLSGKPTTSNKPRGYRLPSSVFARSSSTSRGLKKEYPQIAPLFSDYSESKFEFSFDNPKKMETLMGAKGIFSFGLFRNVHDLHFKADLYKEGIQKYIELTKRSNFKDWVVLVYLDDSVIDHSFFSNEQYLNELLKKAYINSKYENYFQFEEEIKYITSKKINDYFLQEKIKLDGQYIQEIEELKKTITDTQSNEWVNAINIINAKFDKIVDSLNLEQKQQTEDYRNQYLQEEYNQLKQYVLSEIELLIGSIKELMAVLQSEPNCILCKYTIPTFLVPGTPLHYNYIGSMVRFHAIAKFPDKYVCVRDADTYFSYLWNKQIQYKNNSGKIEELTATQRLMDDVAEHYIDYLTIWEGNLMKYHATKNLPFLIAYDTQYTFTNMRKGGSIRNSRFLAGIVDSFPHDAKLYTTEDWERGVKFIRDEEVTYDIRGSKNLYHSYEQRDEYRYYQIIRESSYYGCDEKVLRYIFFEKVKDMNILFYFPYATGNNSILYSMTEEESKGRGYTNNKSFLDIYMKLLEATASTEEKKSSLYELIHDLRDYVYSISYMRRTIGGESFRQKDYFFFASSYPFFADQLAAEYEVEPLENIKPYIKGGYDKKRKSNKSKTQKKKKNKKSLGKSRKNR